MPPKPQAAPLAPKPAAPTAEAVRGDATAAFLREVDEALHAERLLTIWHTSRWWLLAGALATLLAVAGWQAYGAWERHQARSVASAWYELAQTEQAEELAKQLPDFVASSQGGYRVLARMAQAGLAPADEDKTKMYMSIADDATLPLWLRNIGRLNAALVMLSANPAQAKAQLELLAQTDPTAQALPTYAPALELLGLMALQANDTATARAYTSKLLEQPLITPGQRQRALQRMGGMS